MEREESQDQRRRDHQSDPIDPQMPESLQVAVHRHSTTSIVIDMNEGNACAAAKVQ
jgi:hypothetical protein